MAYVENTSEEMNTWEHYNRATYALQVRRYDLAIDLMQKVLSVDPDSSAAYQIIARSYLLKEDIEAAMRACYQALTLDPDDDFNHALYGFLLAEKGRIKEGEGEFKIALELGPESDITHYWYANFLLNKKKDKQGALTHIKHALELDPSDADYHVLLGDVLDEMGDVEGSERAYREALNLEPESWTAHNNYGSLLLNRMKKPGEALQQYKEALRQDPNNKATRENLFLALKAKNKFYALFWQYSLWASQNRTIWIAIIVGMLILNRVVRANLGALGPAAPFVIAIFVLYFLFCVYTWIANPLFDFLIRRGLIR